MCSRKSSVQDSTSSPHHLICILHTITYPNFITTKRENIFFGIDGFKKYYSFELLDSKNILVVKSYVIFTILNMLFIVATPYNAGIKNKSHN